MKVSRRLALALALLHEVAGDWQFRSRPDLAPPRLNITIPATDAVEQGYLFLAPFAGFEDTPTEQHGPRQAGPYIFRDNGDLVWSGYGLYSIWSTNFQAARWKGKDVLFSFEGDHNPLYGHGHGHTTIMDQHYETIRELRAGNHKLTDKHEFHIINEETALIQIYQPAARDLTAWGAKPGQQWIVNAIFQELDISTGAVLFEWSSLDHISPSEAILPLNPGQAGSGYNSSDAWDYFHINSVDKDGAGNYLISARDACSVHKINGTSGQVLWRLGGRNSSFELGEGVQFCFQHHARFLQQQQQQQQQDTHDGGIELISLYDNSAHGSESDSGHSVRTNTTSAGKILRLDADAGTAELVRAFYPPERDLLSKSQGSTQVLPNGNVLVNWGSEGAVTEFGRDDGVAVFHAYMDSGSLAAGVQNYRAFRYNWTGLPSEEPAIVLLDGGGEGKSVHVSWNGDTETAAWRFYRVDGDGRRASSAVLGEVERTSFETVLRFGGRRDRDVSAVAADAIDAAGRVIRSTGVAYAEAEVLPAGGDDGDGEDVGADHDASWEQYALLRTQRLG